MGLKVLSWEEQCRTFSGGFRGYREEIWKDIPGYKGHYQISNFGRVKSLGRFDVMKNGGLRWRNEIIMVKCVLKHGYEYCCFTKNCKGRNIVIHRLVANAFLPKVKGKTKVNHKDTNKRNNFAENLEWCTHMENIIHAMENNRMLKAEQHPEAKFTNEEVREIRANNILSYSKLATKYKVGKSTIARIKTNQNYINV